MGTLTLDQFRDELLFDLKNRSDTTDPQGFSVTRQTMFVNAGYLHVCDPAVYRHREMRHSSTVALATGVGSYAWSPSSDGFAMVGEPYSVAHVEAATDDFTASRTKLFAHDEQWFQERSRITSGAPRDYFIRGNTIIVQPIPSSNENGQVLVVSGWREPVPLSLDGDKTVISTKWDEIVLLAARWRAELHLGYREMAEATKLDFASLINEYADPSRFGGEDWSWTTETRGESHME